MDARPLAIDLFCGLGGWTEGVLAEGYDDWRNSIREAEGLPAIGRPRPADALEQHCPQGRSRHDCEDTAAAVALHRRHVQARCCNLEPDMTLQRIDERMRVLAKQIADAKAKERPVGGQAFEAGNQRGPDGTTRPVVPKPVKSQLLEDEWFSHQGDDA